MERGRHALWRAVLANGLRPGDEVLAPAYHHGSEVEAMMRAGLACRFYEATPTLEPDEEELRELLGPRTRTLHLVHYLSFSQDAGRGVAGATPAVSCSSRTRRRHGFARSRDGRSARRATSAHEAA